MTWREPVAPVMVGFVANPVALPHRIESLDN